jgi:hypothetical protein
MKKKRSSVADDAPANVTVKIPRDLYDEVGALLPHFADDPVVRATGKASKALALRLTLLRGIAAVRADARQKAKGDAAT